MITESEFQSDDPERTEAYYQDGYGWTSRVPVGRAPYGFSLHSWNGERVSFANVTCATDEIIRACVPSLKILIHLPQNGVNQYRIGRQCLDAMAERAIVLPSNHEYTLHSTYGLKSGLVVNADLLLAEIENRWRGRRGHTLIKAGEIQLTSPDRRRLFALHRRFQKLARAESDHDGGRACRVLESEIASWCAERILDNKGCQPLSPRNQMRMDQIIDWIDRHLADPISMDQLSEISGIRSRGLNKICKAAIGMAPMEFVQSRRLMAAHQRLRKGAGDILVSRVALDCGFMHLGRFALSYRRAFGETPSETLEKARDVA